MKNGMRFALWWLAALLAPFPPAVAGGQPQGAAERPVDRTYTADEILEAADRAFGAGAQGLAQAIERIFREQGRPNAYIVGREGAGALGLGIRYGKGTLYSKVEGNRTVHWQGPSLGLDAGGDLSAVFILVYDLHDTEEIFRRYPAIEGRAYLVGGLSVGYHQLGQVRLVPVRLGAGWRLGANVGYLHFTRKRRLLPL